MTHTQAITTHIDHYKQIYTAIYGALPTSWWGFTKWLADSTGASSFTNEDIELAKRLLKEEN